MHCIIVYTFLINLLFKGIGKLWGYVRKLGLFKFLDNFLGVIANVAIIVCLILGVFALIYNLKGEFFVNARELIKSTYLTRFIYKFNPLNSFLSF